MGLDAVELVMEIEDEFGITVDDDELWHFTTLGNIHDYLLEKLGVRKRTDCPTRSAFYRLRQAFGDVMNTDAKALRPDTEVLRLLGRRGRERAWKQIEAKSGLTLPKLIDGTDKGVLWGAAITGGIGLVVVTVLTRDPFVGAIIALLAAIPGMLFGIVFGGFLIRPTVAPCFRTLGGLTRQVAAYNHEQFRLEAGPDTESDPIWERLCKVIVEQLGVKRETLQRSTRFVEDLGC